MNVVFSFKISALTNIFELFYHRSNYNKMRNCVRDEVRDCFKDTEVSDEMADEVAQSVVVESLPMEDAVVTSYNNVILMFL